MSTLALPSQVLDDAGNPAISAELFAYAATSTVPKRLYADRLLTTPHPHPLLADGAGRFPQMFLEAGLYRFVIRAARPDPLGSTPGEILEEFDNFEAVGGGLPEDVLSALTALSPAAANLPALAARAADIEALAEAYANPASNLNRAASLGSVNPARLTLIADNINAITAAAKNPPLGDWADLVSGNVAITSYSDTFTTESGARRWTPKLSRSLPYTPTGAFSDADWLEVVTTAEVTADQFNRALLRISRLDQFHPPAAPVLGPLPNRAVEEGFSGEVVDLADYLTDSDSDPDWIIWNVSGLPDGFSLDGSVIMAAAPAITAPATISVYAEDESGLVSATRTFTLEAYEEGVTPTVAPVFGTIAPYSVPRGNPILARNHKLDVLDADSDADDLTVTGSISPAGSGVTFTGGVRGGTAGAVGTYAASLTVTDEASNEGLGSYAITITDPPAPVLTGLPFGGSRTVIVNSAPVVIDLSLYFTDANTPYAEFGTPVSPYGAAPVLTGAPFASSVSGVTLTLTTSIIGPYRPKVVLKNRAGKTVTIEFDFIVIAFTGGIGGGVDPGDGRWDRLVF
jgi:hypothetical protein